MHDTVFFEWCLYRAVCRAELQMGYQCDGSFSGHLIIHSSCSCELKSLTKAEKKVALDQQTIPEKFMQLIQAKKCCWASWRVVLIQTVPIYFCGYCILFNCTGTSSAKKEWDRWQFDHLSQDASLLMLTTNHADIIYEAYQLITKKNSGSLISSRLYILVLIETICEPLLFWPFFGLPPLLVADEQLD